MIKERRKQIILIIVAITFIGIGWVNFYFQYNNVELASADARNEITLGDVQLVNSEVAEENEEKKFVSELVPNDELQKLENKTIEENNLSLERNEETSVKTNAQTNEEKKNEVENNKEFNNETNQNLNTEQRINFNDRDEYFVETRLEREKMYSQMLETYQKMAENPNVGETQKAIAIQEITNINNKKNGIMIAENLIKNKGFEDVVVFINNDVVSVVVKSSLLTQEQIAKIQNIVSRELKVELQNINISKK